MVYHKCQLGMHPTVNHMQAFKLLERLDEEIIGCLTKLSCITHIADVLDSS